MSICPIGRQNDLWSHSLYYDSKCDPCKHIVVIGSRKFCGYTPPRLAIHQIIRSQIGCVGCEHYTKNIDSQTCINCIKEHPEAEPFEMQNVLLRRGCE